MSTASDIKKKFIQNESTSEVSYLIYRLELLATDSYFPRSAANCQLAPVGIVFSELAAVLVCDSDPSLKYAMVDSLELFNLVQSPREL